MATIEDGISEDETYIDPDTGYTACCGARVTFSAEDKCCKKCFRAVRNPEEERNWVFDTVTDRLVRRQPPQPPVA